jgi:hypothetical protein
MEKGDEKMNRTYKKIRINKKWIEENIIKRDWQRSVYPARVNRFAGYIRTGNFKTSLITVVKSNPDGKYILLDGQHKLEAIKKEDGDFEMDVCIYSDLDEQEEIEIYKMLNEVKPFRLVDDIKVEIGRNDWLDAFFDKQFPIEVTLHGGLNAVKVGDILNILNNGLSPTITRRNLTRNNLSFFLEDLDAEKFGIMKDFCKLYLRCFGSPHRDNWLYKNAIVFTLMRIWIKNKDNFEEDEFIKRFRPIEKAISIKMDATAGVFDTGILEQVTRKMYKIINKGHSKNLFKEFWKEE